MNSGLSRQNSEFLSHIHQFPQSFALAPSQTERRREQPFCLFIFIFFYRLWPAETGWHPSVLVKFLAHARLEQYCLLIILNDFACSPRYL